MDAFSETVRYCLAVTLAGLGLAHAVVPRIFLHAYAERADRRSIRAIGIAYASSGAFLLIPHTHIWGIALAALTLFGAVVGLLNRRHYMFAFLGMLTMAMLPIAIVVAPLS